MTPLPGTLQLTQLTVVVATIPWTGLPVMKPMALLTVGERSRLRIGVEPIPLTFQRLPAISPLTWFLVEAMKQAIVPIVSIGQAMSLKTFQPDQEMIL